MDITKNKKKYEEHSSFSYEEDVYVNTCLEHCSPEIEDMFFQNVKVLFTYEPPERRTAFYPGAEAELDIWGVLYEDKYFPNEDIPKKLEEWLWNHLWEQRSEKHKRMP